MPSSVASYSAEGSIGPALELLTVATTRGCRFVDILRGWEVSDGERGHTRDWLRPPKMETETGSNQRGRRQDDD